jgi:hypothetical protein
MILDWLRASQVSFQLAVGCIVVVPDTNVFPMRLFKISRSRHDVA